VLPENFTGVLVERAELLVHGGANEDQPTLRYDCPAEHGGAGGLVFRRHAWILAEWNLPLDGTLVEVHRGQRSPGRFDAGSAELVAQLLVPGVGVRPLHESYRC